MNVTEDKETKITKRMIPRMKVNEESRKKNSLSNLFRDSSKIELLPF